jgi:hypothetical protein
MSGEIYFTNPEFLKPLSHLRRFAAIPRRFHLFLERGEIAVQNAMFFMGKKSVGVCTTIMAIAQRSCCDCMAFTLRLLAICGRLYRVLSDSTPFSRRSYCDLSVFIACSKRCLPMMTGMKNKPFFFNIFYQHLYHSSKEV